MPQFVWTETWGDCNGFDLFFDVTGSAGWTSSNTAVATVNDTTLKGLATGVAGGSATITATFTDSTFVWSVAEQICKENSLTLKADAACDVVKLVCGPSSGTQGAVTRDSTVYCALSNLPGGATTSNWNFTDGTNTITPSTNPGTSWSGTAVTGGTVSVKVTSGSNSPTLSATLTVNARTGWTWTAVSPLKEANGAGTGSCTGQLPLLPSPPVPGSIMGSSCLVLSAATYTTNTIAGGPNDQYKYNGSAGSNASVYQWERVPDLDNTGSVFYSKQTGTYNSSTNPSGCISGANLASQVQRHEIGSVQGHWGEYSDAQANPSNNQGTIIEARVGPPSQTVSQFQSLLNGDLNNAKTAIGNAFSVEPYGVDHDQNGTFLGWVNYPPSYNSCQ